MWQGKQDDAERKRKEAFALACLKNGDDYFKAALEVFGQTQGGLALRYMDEWAADPYVLERKAELKAELGEDAFLPTKVELARKVWSTADSALFTADKLKGFELYGRIMDYITKDGGRAPTGPINVTLSTTDAKL